MGSQEPQTDLTDEKLDDLNDTLVSSSSLSQTGVEKRSAAMSIYNHELA